MTRSAHQERISAAMKLWWKKRKDSEVKNTRDPRPVSERNIHKAVCDALGFFAAPGVVWWHTANERRATPQEGAFLKRMGVRAGVADFTLVIPRNYCPEICFLELKSAKGRLSVEQKAFRDDVGALGCKFAVPRSVDEALTILHDWGAIVRTRRFALRSSDVRAVGER